MWVIHVFCKVVKGVYIFGLLLSGVYSLTDFCKEPVGMERNIIRDSQLKASSSSTDRGPEKGRLNSRDPWCAAAKIYLPSTYFEIDLGQDMLITKISLQGDPTYHPNYIKKYKLYYSSRWYIMYSRPEFLSVYNVSDSGNSELVFDGISGIKSDGTSTKSVELAKFRFNGRYIRLYPREFNGDKVCLRLELYGCLYVCFGGLGFEQGGNLTNTTVVSASTYKDGHEPVKARLNALTEWCSSTLDQNQYLHLDLGSIMTVTGIAMQGSSSSDNWVQSFTVEFGDTPNDLTTVQLDGNAKTFIGNIDRNTIVMNWFPSRIETRHLRIRPKTWFGGICMRMEITGCKNGVMGAVGLEKYTVPSTSFTYSSGYGGARLNVHSAWCAARNETQPVRTEWIAINFEMVIDIRGLSIQGNPKNPSEYLSQIIVEHSFDGQNWDVLKEEDGNNERTFTGSYNGAAAQFQQFPESSFSAKHIRLRGNLMHGNRQCLRLEVYGYPQYCTSSLGVKMGSQLLAGTVFSSKNGPLTSPVGRLDSSKEICSSAGGDYFQVTFARPVTMRGLALQWRDNKTTLTSIDFTIRYGNPPNLNEMRKNGRITTFRIQEDPNRKSYLWFPVAVESRAIRISFPFSRQCIRLDVLGCENACLSKLGIESGSIADHAITASSSLQAASLPKYSRLNFLNGAWISCRTTSSCIQGTKETDKEWIQACFDRFKTIGGLIIQGGGSLTSDRILSFSLLYSYRITGTFHKYEDSEGPKVFHPKTSRYSSYFVTLPIPITALCLRLQVESFKGNNAALRWEILGCSKVLKPTLSMKPNFLAKRGSTVSMQCEATGQPGVIFRWNVGSLKVEKNALTQLSMKSSNGTLKGTTTSNLTLHIIPKDIGATDGKCSLYDPSHGFFHCLINITCFASYADYTERQMINSVLNITEIRGKSTEPLTLSANQITATEFKVMWNTPADVGDFAFKHYQVALFQNNIQKEVRTTLYKTYNWGLLLPKTNYTIKVSYINVEGFKSPEAAINVQTSEGAPTAPRNLTLISKNSTAITVLWKVPVPANGFISKYRIKYSNLSTKFIDVAGDLEEYTIGYLQEYTLYTVQVQAFTKKGALEGPWSSTEIVRTAEGRPSAPNFPVVTNNTNGGEITFKWETPTRINGILHYYKVKAKGVKPYNISFIDNHEKTTNSTTTSLVTFGGTDYVVEIIAVTGAGEGSKATFNVTTPGLVPQRPVVHFTKIASGKQIDIYPSTDTHGPISWYEIVIFEVPNNCSELITFPRPADLSAVIPPFSSPHTVKVILGEKKLKGANISLTLVGNYTFCFRIVSKFKNDIKYGPPSSVRIERSSLPKLAPVLQSEVSSSTFRVQLIKSMYPDVKYYHICVVELSQGKRVVDIDADAYPPSLLGPHNKNNHAVNKPYITAEFSADKFNNLSSFVIGDGKTYSGQQRKKRSIGGLISYVNAPLTSGKTYSVFQRALVSTTLYYTSPWIPPVTLGIVGVTEDVDDFPTAAIVGSVIAVVTVASIIIVVIYLYKRRERKKTKNASQLSYYDDIAVTKVSGIKNPVMVDDEMDSTSYSRDNYMELYEVAREAKYPSKYQPLDNKDDSAQITPDNIVKTITQLQEIDENGKSGYQKQFEKLQSARRELFETESLCGRREKNLTRNRDPEIVPKDIFRVKLQGSANSKEDYINATVIKDREEKVVFIATQYPLSNTIGDFWEMVYENNVKQIVLLIELKEETQLNEEFHGFCPSKGMETVNKSISVTTITAQMEGKSIRNVLLRLSKIECEASKEHKECRLTQVLLWDNLDTPRNKSDFIKTTQKLIDLKRILPENNPTLVVCTNGANRCGLLIALTLAMENFLIDGYCNLPKTINRIRHFRPQFINSLEQYTFCYEALIFLNEETH